MKRIFRPLVSLALLLSLVLPQSVFAATQTLAVNGEGSLLDGAYNPAADWHNVTSNDDSTTLWYASVSSGDPSKNRTWNLENVSTYIPAGSTINSVTVYAKTKGFPFGFYYHFIYRTGGLNYQDSGHFSSISPTWAFQDSGTYFANNPSTGLSWTIAQLDSAEFGVRVCYLEGMNISITAYVTYFYAVVDYTAPTLPAVITNAASYISCTYAMLNGSITSTGGENADYYGFGWGTASQAQPNSATSPAACSYSENWTSGIGSYGVASYSDNATSLTPGVPYYYRFAAHNSLGWAWSVAEGTFTTLTVSTIIVQAATDISVSTARLQSYLSSSGGEACQVRFGYGTVNQGDNITAYEHYSSYAGAYNTGESPYLDMDNLTAITTYFFNVEALNSCGTGHGTVTSFPTLTSVGSPSNVTAIPSTTSIVLSWTKGAGAPNTFIRCKANTCPVNETDGTLVYFSTASTYTHTGLTSGVDYCYYIVGYDAIEGYSVGHVVIHATTLAAGIVFDTTGTVISKPSGMTQTPSVPGVLESNIPIFPAIRASSTSTGIPMGSFVFILLLIVLTGLSFGIWRWNQSIELIVVIWIFASWISYLLFGRPLVLLVTALFVTFVGLGYGAYKIRSLI